MFAHAILLCHTVIFLLGVAEVHGLSCYECHGSTSLPDNGCGYPNKTSLTITPNCTSCGITILSSRTTGVPHNLTRACLSARHGNGTSCSDQVFQNQFGQGQNQTGQGQNQTGQGGQGQQQPLSSACYCHTDLCNDMAAYYVGSLQCYVCSSADFIQNGCGSTLNSSSMYVSIVSGCSTCVTVIRKLYPGGALSYVRSCGQDIGAASTACTGVNSTYPCTYTCRNNLCNDVISVHQSKIFFILPLLLLLLKM